MKWKIEFNDEALDQLRALDKSVRERIKKAIQKRLEFDPKAQLKPLVGPLRGLYKFRVGDWRLFCTYDDGIMLVLVVQIVHRSEAHN